MYNDNMAIYLQIAEKIIDQILKGKFKSESRIPSVREMAIDCEVNPNTVMRTYTYLQEQGIVYNKRGIGYFVSADAFDLILKNRRENFINSEIPAIIQQAKLLGFTVAEFTKLLEESYEEV